jgi:anti-sigma B factor antagonist
MNVSRASQMSVERSTAGPSIVLRIKGEIDIASAPTLRAVVDGVLDSPAQELCIDLSPTTFLDSSGVHLLFQSMRRAETSGWRLTIVVPEGNVRRVLRLCGLENELPLSPRATPIRIAAPSAR